MSDTNFTRSEIALLKERDELKTRLADIDEALKPAIERVATGLNLASDHADLDFPTYGVKIRVQQSSRETTKWKELAVSVIPAKKLDAIKPDFTSLSVTASARILKDKD